MTSAPTTRILAAILLAWWCGAAVHANAGADAAAQAQRRPKMFYSVFNFGYGGDDFPDDPTLFEKIAARVADEGRFNAIMCAWSEERAAVCRKHGLKMMVDLLNGRHHVYKTPDETKALLETLRGNDVVMGYHLWSDEFGGTAEGRARDIHNCHEWDPTHPCYSATRKTSGLGALAEADIFGWYDFHWKRSGWHRHFAALDVALPLARRHGSVFYTLLSTDSGRPGAGNYNRSLWSLNQGVAFGMKGALWFIGMRQMDKGTGEWTDFGRDINKVNAQIMPLREELPRIGLPTAVFATPITKDANNRDVQGAPTMLGELSGHAFPADFWIKPEAGEFTMGVFKDDQGRDAVYVANLNAYAPQTVKLRLGKSLKASKFDRPTGSWGDLPSADGTISFETGPAEGELLRFDP